mgnify:CR=1 FL=1
MESNYVIRMKHDTNLNDMHTSVLVHHGIKGQKWGVRRYQNEDGTLTTLGAKRYSIGEKRIQSRIKKLDKKASKLNYSFSAKKREQATQYNKRLELEREMLKDERNVINVGNKTVGQLRGTAVVAAGQLAATVAFGIMNPATLIVNIPATLATTGRNWYVSKH